MKLNKYILPPCVIVGLSVDDKWQVIEKLLQRLARAGVIEDQAQVRADLFAREKKMSTGMEEGLALPHAKSDGARALAVAVGISPEGVDFDSLDGKPAQVIFLVVSRKDITGPHIQCLAEIARLYRKEACRRRLQDSRMPEDVMRALSECD